MHARGFKKIIIFYRDILERKVDFCTFSRVNTSYQWFFFHKYKRKQNLFFCSTFSTSCRKLQCRNWEMRDFFFTKSPRNNFTNSSCFALGNPNFTPFESLMIIGVRKKNLKLKNISKGQKCHLNTHTYFFRMF